MKTINIAILAALLSLTPACLVVDDDHVSCYGDDCYAQVADMGFYWGFELWDGSVTDNCLEADVARVDVVVYNDYGEYEYEVLDRPCNDLGLDLMNFFPGWYEIELTARCDLGIITHEAWYETYLDPGFNEFGVLVLDYVRPCQ